MAESALRSSHEALSRTELALESGLRNGYYSQARVMVRCGTHTLRAAVGAPISAGNAPIEPLYPLFCAAKPLLALAVALLVERGDLSYEDLLGDLIPGFGRYGKTEVRLGHVLLYTSGFRQDPACFHLGKPWPDVIDAICQARLEDGWSPGMQACYQPFSYWYLVGEILMNVTGQPLGQLLRTLVLDPFGLSDTWVGMTPCEYSRNASRLVQLIPTKYESPAEALAPLGPGPSYPTDLSTEQVCCAYADYSSRGSLGDLVQLYATLADPAASAAVIPTRVREQVIARRRRGMVDQLSGIVSDVGYGVSSESRMYGTRSQRHGKWASDQSFGHAGGFCVVGFGDPVAGIAAAYGVDGSAGPVRNWHRTQAIFTAIYEDLEANS